MSCGEDNPPGSLEEDVLSFSQKEESFTKGCASDTPGCVRVALNFPVAEDGPGPAVEGIERATNWFINSYLSAKIDYDAIYRDFKPAIREYLDQKYAKQRRAKDIERKYYSRIRGKILFENSKIISLKMQMKSFSGGAHPLQLVDLYTVDVSSSKWHHHLNAYISDHKAFEQTAERYFRKKRNISEDKNLNKAGFQFRSGFELPKSMGFTPRGVLFYYNSYEVAPRSMGPTTFTIPYEDLEHSLNMDKIKPENSR